MKAISFVTCALMLCVSTIALSQSEMHKPDSQKSDAQQAPTQLAFARLKTLAGNWKGQSPVGPLRVSMRVTSGGSALMHEMVPEGRSDDPTSTSCAQSKGETLEEAGPLLRTALRRD